MENENSQVLGTWLVAPWAMTSHPGKCAGRLPGLLMKDHASMILHQGNKMTKCIARKIEDSVIGYYIWCQGCKCAHFYPISLPSPQHWVFSGTLDSPTFTPSLLHYVTHPETKARVTTCHINVTDGKIQFHTDCPFELKGQTLDLQDIPEDYHIPGRN